MRCVVCDGAPRGRRIGQPRRIERDTRIAGQHFQATAPIADIPTQVLHVVGVPVRLRQDARERERIEQREADRVVVDRAQIDLAAADFAVAPHRTTELSDRLGEIPRSERREVRREVADVAELEVDETGEPRVVEHELPRVADQKRELLAFPRHVPFAPAELELDHRLGALLRRSVAALEAAGLAETALLSAPRPIESDRLELLDRNRVDAGELDEIFVEHRPPVPIIGRGREIEAPGELLEHEARRILTESVGVGHAHAVTLEHLDDPPLALEGPGVALPLAACPAPIERQDLGRRARARRSRPGANGAGAPRRRRVRRAHARPSRRPCASGMPDSRVPLPTARPARSILPHDPGRLRNPLRSRGRTVLGPRPAIDKRRTEDRRRIDGRSQVRWRTLKTRSRRSEGAMSGTFRGDRVPRGRAARPASE